MSLNSLMGKLTNSQFLNTNRFAELVWFYKGDDVSTGVQVPVVWDQDTLPGTNEVDGDGVVLEKRSGRRVRESIKIECHESLNVEVNEEVPDRFVRGDQIALVKRIMAADSSGMKLVLCIHIESKNDRGRYRMG